MDLQTYTKPSKFRIKYNGFIQNPVRNHEVKCETWKASYMSTNPFFCSTKLKKVSRKKGSSRVSRGRSFKGFVDFLFVFSNFQHISNLFHLCRTFFGGSVKLLFFQSVHYSTLLFTKKIRKNFDFFRTWQSTQNKKSCCPLTGHEKFSQQMRKHLFSYFRAVQTSILNQKVFSSEN